MDMFNSQSLTGKIEAFCHAPLVSHYRLDCIIGRRLSIFFPVKTI
jgi:hypothetical protein